MAEVATVNEVMADLDAMKKKIRELEARSEVARVKKALPKHVSAAPIRGDKEPLRMHNEYVSKFLKKYGKAAEGDISNIFHQ